MFEDSGIIKKVEATHSFIKNSCAVVNKFKYLGFTWTDRISLKPTVDQTVEKIQRTFVELKGIKMGKHCQ